MDPAPDYSRADTLETPNEGYFGRRVSIVAPAGEILAQTDNADAFTDVEGSEAPKVDTEDSNASRTLLDEAVASTRSLSRFYTKRGKADEQDGTGHEGQLTVLRITDEARDHVIGALRSQVFLSDDPWRTAFDLVLLIGVFFYCCFTPLVFADLWPEQMEVLVAMQVAVSVIFVLDILICFRTAFVDSFDRLVEEADMIERHYLGGFFLIDVIAALPLDLALYAAGFSQWKYMLILRHFKLIKVASLMAVSPRSYITGPYVTFHFHYKPLIILAFWTSYLLHLLTIIWIALGSEAWRTAPECLFYYGAVEPAAPPLPTNTSTPTFVSATSTASLTANATANVASIVTQPLCASTRLPYLRALYFLLYTLSTVGFGDLEVASSIGRLYICVLAVSSILLNGLLVGKLAASSLKADIDSERGDKMRETLSIMRHYDIPGELTKEVLAFQFHLLHSNASQAFSKALEALPDSMRQRIGLYIRLKAIARVPLFSAASALAMVALAEAMSQVVIEPEENIITAGVEGNEMFFLTHGLADVLTSDGHFITTIRKGGFFGEMALITEEKRSATIRAITYCDLFKLEKESFNEILLDFPQFKKDIVRQTLERQLEQARIAAAAASSPSPPSRLNSMPPSHVALPSLLSIHRSSLGPLKLANPNTEFLRRPELARKNPSTAVLPSYSFPPPQVGDNKKPDDVVEDSCSLDEGEPMESPATMNLGEEVEGSSTIRAARQHLMNGHGTPSKSNSNLGSDLSLPKSIDELNTTTSSALSIIAPPPPKPATKPATRWNLLRKSVFTRKFTAKASVAYDAGSGSTSILKKEKSNSEKDLTQGHSDGELSPSSPSTHRPGHSVSSSLHPGRNPRSSTLPIRPPGVSRLHSSNSLTSGYGTVSCSTIPSEQTAQSHADGLVANLESRCREIELATLQMDATLATILAAALQISGQIDGLDR